MMILGTQSDNDYPLLDVEMALRHFNILWPHESASNTDIFLKKNFKYLRRKLIAALTSSKAIVTAPIINKSMLVAIFGCETYQDTSLLDFIVEQFSTNHSFDIICHLNDIYYLPFLKRVCQLCPTAGNVIVIKILFYDKFIQMLDHREFVELLSRIDLTDYSLQLNLSLSPDAESNTLNWPSILLELAVKLTDFGKVDMLLSILRNDIALHHIRGNNPLDTRRYYYLIKAVLKCAEHDNDLAIRLLENPSIPIDIIRKTEPDCQRSFIHVGEDLFLLIAHFWINSTDLRFKRALKASVLSRTPEAIDIDVEIKELDFNACEIALLSINTHNFPHDYTCDNLDLGDTFRRHMNVPLLVANFGEKNPSLLDLVQSDEDLNKVAVSAIKSRRLKFILNLLNRKSISLGWSNPLSEVLAKTSTVVDKLVYLAMLMGQVFYDTRSRIGLPDHNEIIKRRQIQTKLTRVRERIKKDRKTFWPAAIGCGSFSDTPDIQRKILGYVYPWLTMRHLQAGPAIVNAWNLKMKKGKPEDLAMDKMVDELVSLNIKK